MIGHRLPKGVHFALLSLLLSALAPVARATPADTGDHAVTRLHESMGTLVQITVWGQDDEPIVKAIAQAFAEFDRIDRLMTTWLPESEVSQINTAAGAAQGVKVSDELFAILLRAQDFSRMSDGAFDITVGSFAGLWKFDWQDNDGSIPTAAAVTERRKLVSWKDLELDPAKKTARLKRKGQKITLGGIAKGYAVDRGVALLHKAGLVDFIVQAGGDMYVAGRKGDRRWRVGIRDPRGSASEFFAAAELEDETFSTSGDYERFVIKDGRRYHHIIDPATGYPASKCRSVTVVAKDGMTAEGLTKAIFILGPERGMALVEKTPGVAAVIVGADNKVSVSKGLQGRIVIGRQPTASDP
jgi:FAD:protein FMN transferase